MGANFAPSYANLTMGQWESSHIWHKNTVLPNIIFLGRYIDVIIIWDSDASLVSDFNKHCKHKQHGLVLHFCYG